MIETSKTNDKTVIKAVMIVLVYKHRFTTSELPAQSLPLQNRFEDTPRAPRAEHSIS